MAALANDSSSSSDDAPAKAEGSGSDPASLRRSDELGSEGQGEEQREEGEGGPEE